MKTAYILVGPSCVGKSTVAKRILKYRSPYYISRDTERESCFGTYRMGNKTEEAIITELVYYKISVFQKIGPLVLDSTHLRLDSLERQHNFIDLPKKYVIFPNIPLLMLVKRNQKRYKETGKLIPLDVLKKQLKAFEKLKESSFYDKIQKIGLPEFMADFGYPL